MPPPTATRRDQVAKKRRTTLIQPGAVGRTYISPIPPAEQGHAGARCYQLRLGLPVPLLLLKVTTHSVQIAVSDSDF